MLYITYNTMRFKWDSAKDRSNQEKHDGIDFELASRIFGDPNLVIEKDRVADGEQRWHGIGMVQRGVLAGGSCVP